MVAFSNRLLLTLVLRMHGIYLTDNRGVGYMSSDCLSVAYSPDSSFLLQKGNPGSRACVPEDQSNAPCLSMLGWNLESSTLTVRPGIRLSESLRFGSKGRNLLRVSDAV